MWTQLDFFETSIIVTQMCLIDWSLMETWVSLMVLWFLVVLRMFFLSFCEGSCAKFFFSGLWHFVVKLYVLLRSFSRWRMRSQVLFHGSLLVKVIISLKLTSKLEVTLIWLEIFSRNNLIMRFLAVLWALLLQMK